MYRSTTFLLPIFLGFPTAHLTAEVIDVRGPSPDHPEIDAAIIAASDGDVIRIWPGDYQPFWIDDRSLTLVSADDTGSVMVNGTFRVMNLGAGRSVEISGISSTSPAARGLVVSDCQGSVRFRECNFRGGYVFDGSVGDLQGILVTGCEDVEFSSCTALGGHVGDVYGDGNDGASGLRVENSRVSLYHSTFAGHEGYDGWKKGSSGGYGGAGISAGPGGRVYLSGCTLIGGDGGSSGPPDPPIFPGVGGDGGWGYRGWGSPLPEAWFLDNTYQPGEGGYGDSGDGLDGQNTSAGTHLPGQARLFRASRLIDDTSTIGLIFTGSPGDLVTFRISRVPGYSFDPERGPLLLHRPSAPLILPWRILGTIDASGVFVTTLPTADLPSFGHSTLHLQGNLIGSENYYTSSSWAVILDAAW